MKQDTRPAPFNMGDHVRYIGPRRHVSPETHGGDGELVLAPGMEGVILLSTGAFPEQGHDASKPWHCQVQFKNGFQFDINPFNCDEFEGTETPPSAT